MVFLILFFVIFATSSFLRATEINGPDTLNQVTRNSFTFESSDVKFTTASDGVKKYAVNFLLPGTAFRETNRYKNVAYKSIDFIAFSSLIYFVIKRNLLVRDARSFAGRHAGIYPRHGEDFLYDMSEHISLSEHNNVMLLQANVSDEGDRNFFLAKMYDETESYYWEWDTRENLNVYRGIISDHKRSLNYMYAFLGVLVLNRAVSFLDLYINSRISVRYSGTRETLGFSVVVEK